MPLVPPTAASDEVAKAGKEEQEHRKDNDNNPIHFMRRLSAHP
jgi:hypothetical protein